MFLHASFLHIFINMIFLAIFGPTVEDTVGRLRFPLLYLLGAVLALAIQVAAQPNSPAPALGSSGAIAAVLGGYLLLYPHARVLVLSILIFFATLLAVPAVLLIGLWFLEQGYLAAATLAGARGYGSSSEIIAYLAHIASFLFGLLTIRLFASRAKPQPLLPVY
jgi:membrane associated rhomboid family serine protease